MDIAEVFSTDEGKNNFERTCKIQFKTEKQPFPLESAEAPSRGSFSLISLAGSSTIRDNIKVLETSFYLHIL